MRQPVTPRSQAPAAPRRAPAGRRAAAGALALAAAIAAAIAVAPASAVELPPGVELVQRAQPAADATPPLPPTEVFPVQLVLDDDSAESAVGVADASGARQFLWFNRFAPPAGPGFVLEEVWVLFPAASGVNVGDAIELAVYVDPDGDPTNGADLLATFDETVQAVDGDTFSLYPLAAPVPIEPGGDVLIGVVPRFVQPGDPLNQPAALDQTASQGRSWLAIWTGDPPDDPELPPDALITLVDDLGPGLAGNWMIRGFGTDLGALEIPALGGAGLVGLAALLLAAGWLTLARRRHRAGGALGVALALLVASPAGAQPVEIDPFTTVHGPLSAPPTSISTAGPGAMIAAFRDLEIERLSGTGTSTVEVAGGVLTFTAAAGDRARISVIYDGESTTDFDPSILPAFDMIGFGHGSFRLQAAVTGSPASAVIEVYTDAANWSRAALALPVGAMADHFVDLSELVVAGGTGADLNQVRALVFRIVAEDGAVVTVEEFFAEPPAVEAAQADFTDAGAPIGGGSVVPGETFRYRVTIDNTGGAAEGVDLSNVLDPALIPGTFRTTPVVRPDQYTGFGNVDLVVDGVGLPDLVANDSDPDGDPVNVVPAVDLATAQGGEVDVAADGTFAYTPPAGFTGVDTFTYTVAPVAGDPTEDASDNPVGPFTGTVSIALDRTVWFVDNSHGGPFEGTQTNPFATLGDAETASGPGDIIRLRRGDGTTTGYDLGMIMKEGQHLIGGGVPLVIEGQTIEPADAGGRPQVTHGAGGHALELVFDHVIHGVDFVDSDLSGMHGVDVGTLEVRETSITGAGAEAMDIDGGDLDVELDDLSSDGSPTHGLRLVAVTGSLTVSGSTMVSNLSGVGGNGIEIVDSPGVAVDLGATAVSGSPLAGAGSGGPGIAGLSGVGVNLVNNPGATITFDSLSVSAPSIGLIADNAGTVNVNSTTATVTGAVGAAVEINDTAGQTNGLSGWTFQSLASSNSGGFGVFLDGLTDDFLVTGSIQIDEIGGTAILVSDCPGRSIDFGTVTAVDDNVGGGATADGIDLVANNAGAVFTFDNLTLVTDGGFGLRAGASTLAFGVGNFIAANGGPALDLDGTTVGGIAPLGGGGVANFVEITSVGSPGQGVTLVGVTGEMFVAGGFIQNPAGTAFRVDAGSPVVTYHGQITQPNAALVVEVEGTSGGMVSFPGQVTGTAAALGVRLDGNAGNVAFDGLDLGTAGTPLGSTAVTLVGGSTGLSSFADMQVFTTGATGFSADDGGVVEVTGAGNLVTTTNGTAVRMFGGTTIGANGATFDAISASGGDNGIHLADTDTAGVFTVTGDGSDARNGSGGTIQNTTGDGVLLSNAHGVVLRSLNLHEVGDSVDSSNGGNDLSTNDHAIQSEGSSGVVLSGVHVRQPAAGGWEAVDLSGINRIDNDSLFEDVNVSNMQALEVRNTDTDLASLTIDGSTFRDQPDTNGSSFVIISSRGTSSMGFTVTNGSLFENLFGHAVQVNAGDAAGSTGVVTTLIEGSTFQNAVDGMVGVGASGGIGGVVIAASEATRHDFTIQNNTFFELGRPLVNGGLINVQAITGGGILDGDILNNDVDRIGFPDAGETTSGVGHRVIDVVAENTTPRVDVRIEGNAIDETSREAIFVSSRGTSGTGGGGGDEYFDVRIHDNDIGQTVAVGTTNREAVEILSEDGSRMRIEVTDNRIRGNTSILDQVVDVDIENTSTMDLTMTGNTVVNLQGGGGVEVVIDTENGTSNLCLDFRGNTAVEVELDVNGTFRVEDFADIAANNPGVGTFLDGAGVTGVATGTCDAPTF